MPSVTQNRMRLARMTGAQAVSAVMAPAPHLVTETVAEAVVRFVAGGTDLARAEVEPSLLSLICRELNNARIAQGHAEISADLLAGSRDTILSEFYERALADQPAGVRVFIEDEMLTDSGFRESVAEERLRKGFAAAGAAPDALAVLVNRRLLRVEDRLDLRRVEITHDVLCGVIAASRSVRREREALEESKRQLALQKERELATQRALRRARTVAAVCAALMLVAAASAVFGWINLRRAREAERRTQAAQLLTEKARSEAEKLIGFLLEDFYEELQPTGRIEIVGNLADKAVAYYDNLPPELITKQTQLYRGMALIRKAGALADGGHTVDAVRVANEAGAIFERLRAVGDVGDTTSLGLALARSTRSLAGFTQRNQKDLEEAIGLLRPFVASGQATRATKLALADALQFLALEIKSDEGIAKCEESRKILTDMGALTLADLTAASLYGDVCDTESRLALSLGRMDEAEKLSKSVGEIAEKVLAKRPGDLRAMRDQFESPDVLGSVARAREDYPADEGFQRAVVQAAKNYILFNPTDSYGWQTWSRASNQIASSMLDQGRVSDAIQQWHITTEMEKDPRNITGSAGGIYYAWRGIAITESQRGRLDDARSALVELHRMNEIFQKDEGADDGFVQVASVWRDLYALDILASKGDYEAIHSRATALDERLHKITPKNALTRNIRTAALRQDHMWIVESSLRTGRGEEALSAANAAVEHPEVNPTDEKTLVDSIVAQAQTRLGQSLIASGRRTEALAALSPAITYYRSRQEKGAGATSYRQDFGKALYQEALAQNDDEAGRAKRRALLDEAQSVLAGLSQEAQQLRTSKELIGWVSDARANPGG
jgi:tetratricopeptide (TPR) repeat protein